MMTDKSNSTHDLLADPSVGSRIIAENDTHAVVAIRLEKRWIQDNIHFLAALANLMPSSSSPSTARR